MLLTKEKIVLLLKLSVVLVLFLCSYLDNQILQLIIFSAGAYFSYSALQNKRTSWALAYLVIAAVYCPIFQASFKYDFLLMINFVAALTILFNIFSWYFLSENVKSLCRDKKYSKAEKVAIEALDTAFDVFGLFDKNYVISLNELIKVYELLGKHDEAEAAYKQVLDLRSQAIDKDYLGDAKIINNFGLFQFSRHKYTHAETLFRNALSIREKYLNRNHPDIAKVLNNLALTLRFQHRYEESESLFKKALVLWEKNSKKHELDLAKCLSNLGEFYNAQGKYNEAEYYYESELKIREKSLDENLHDVVISLQNLAFIYYSQNKNEKADALLERMLEIAEGDDLEKDYSKVESISRLYSLWEEKESKQKKTILKPPDMKDLNELLGINSTTTPEHRNTTSSPNKITDDVKSMPVAVQEKNNTENTHAEPVFQLQLDLKEKVPETTHNEIIIHDKETEADLLITEEQEYKFTDITQDLDNLFDKVSKADLLKEDKFTDAKFTDTSDMYEWPKRKNKKIKS